jgi:hypothetical protein
MPWMRVAIGVGGGGLVAGLVGMAVWINDGSHYFELAVALASAGFLTLVACELTKVFGSSHGSQDDAFRRGQSMGYDTGFLEGHRTARPVVVPLRGVDRVVDPDLEAPVSEMDHVDQVSPPPTTLPLWSREAIPLSHTGASYRVVPWVWAKRVPLLAGSFCVAVAGVLVANAMVPTPDSADALGQPSGAVFQRVVPPSGATPALVNKPEHPAWSVSVGAGGTLVVPGVAGVSPLVQGGTGVAQVAPAVGAAALQPVAAMSSLPGIAVSAPSTFSTVSFPAAPSPVTAPAVAPAVAAPVVPLTAAQQTAADALTAANLTAANALAASNLTAANAASAAAETARVAAAAAETTRLQAIADAYAVAHPAG